MAMLHRGRSNGAEVIVLRRQPDHGIRFTVSDRIEIARRAASLDGTGIERLVIHERLPWDPPELGDFLSIYSNGKPWAGCCIARERGRLLVWCAVTGREKGPFENMAAALDTIMGPPKAVAPGRPRMVSSAPLPAAPIRIPASAAARPLLNCHGG